MSAIEGHRPGMGVDIVPERAERYLAQDDAGFFG